MAGQVPILPTGRLAGSTGGLARSARTITLLSILILIVGFLRTAIIAAALGASAVVDSYNLGLVGPSLVSLVVGAWLQISFVGRYAAMVAVGDTQLAQAYRSRIFFLLLFCTLILSAICFSAPDLIMEMAVPDGRTTLTSAAANVLRITGFTLIPLLLSDFLALVLNSHGRFLAGACAPLLNAIVSVAGLWLWPEIGLGALVWTFVAGSLVQLMVVAFALYRAGLRISFNSTAATTEVYTTLLIGLPLLPAMALGNSSTALIQFKAASFGEGAVSLFGYASRFHLAVVQVVIVGLSTVLLPHFAARWARGEKAELGTLFRRLARLSIPVTLASSVSVFLMGGSAVSLLLGRGQLSPSDSQAVGHLWAVLSLGLFPAAFGTFIAKFCQALRHSITVLISAIVSFVSTLFVLWMGGELGSFYVVCGALAGSALAGLVFWMIWLSRYIPVGALLGDISQGILRAAVILAPASALEIWLSSLTAGLPPVVDLLVRAVGFAAAMIAVAIGTGSVRWFLAVPTPKELGRIAAHRPVDE